MQVNVNFFDGAFCEILEDNDNQYYVQFIDKETNEIIHDDVITSNMWIKSAYSYFINYRVRIIDFKSKILIDEIDYNCESKNVYIWFDSSSLGDNLSWIPFVEEFRLKHKCNVYCSTYYNELFTSMYPNIKFVSLGTELSNLYASYSIGCFNNKTKERKNWKLLNNQEICANILGLDYKEIRPKIYIHDTKRKIEEKYVCFSINSTAQAKLWNNPIGWQETCDFLVKSGLTPVLIQSEPDNSLHNIINRSGPKDIHETINLLYNCEFFIGLGSGLSWLAWALNKPTILISGFSLPKSEFFTPFRIINKNVCHGCWNNPNYNFDKGDWNWCPKLKGTDRQFECSKSITSQMVIDKIESLIK